MRYYKVTAKCGHVSNGYYVDKDFPIKAMTGSDASQKVKRMPRVKKQLKDKITSCIEISRKEYIALLKIYRNDKYFQCTCKNQQLALCPEIISEKQEIKYMNKKYKKINYHYRILKEKQIINIARNIVKNEVNFSILNYNI